VLIQINHIDTIMIQNADRNRQRNIVTDTIWTPDLSQYPGPKYLGLSRALRDAIRHGELAEGAQLPTVRDLAWAVGVTPGTVSRAYQLATQEGLLAATVGRGTFVACSTPRFGPTQAIYAERELGYGGTNVDLRSPQLPSVGQAEIFSAAMQRVAATVSADWLDYSNQRAEAPLRAAVCEWLADRDLGQISAEDIALTYGGQNAVSLILQCCLRGDRPVVITEELCYPGFARAARLSRADVVGIEMDGEGIKPDALEAACRRYGPQILCLTTEAQNPTVARMSLARREDIVRVARKFELQIIEDDCYSVADMSLPAIRALAPERTWYVGGISKTVSAALRFGYIACPTGMGEAGRLTAQHSFFALSRPLSDFCLDLFQSGAAKEIRTRVQAEFGDRLQSMVNMLAPYDLRWQKGLTFAWLNLPSDWCASDFTRMAESRAVLVRSADVFALVHGRAPHAVRLALAGGIPRAQFEGGLATLSQLLRNPPLETAV
jgi:DNA-binding transcriptional MocR family regulator